MNIRKPSDYSSLYSALNVLMGSDLAETELYCEIGRAVCARTEKGAAVMAAEYLQAEYPDRKGFSPVICAVCGPFIWPMETHRPSWKKR